MQPHSYPTESHKVEFQGLVYSHSFLTTESDAEKPEFYIDEDCIMVIEAGIQRNRLFPISWFRIDLGIRSLETLELWDEIKDNPDLQDVLDQYDEYLSELMVKTFEKPKEFKELSDEEFEKLDPAEKRKYLKERAKALKESLQEDYESFWK